MPRNRSPSVPISPSAFGCLGLWVRSKAADTTPSALTQCDHERNVHGPPRNFASDPHGDEQRQVVTVDPLIRPSRRSPLLDLAEIRQAEIGGFTQHGNPTHGVARQVKPLRWAKHAAPKSNVLMRGLLASDLRQNEATPLRPALTEGEKPAAIREPAEGCGLPAVGPGHANGEGARQLPVDRASGLFDLAHGLVCFSCLPRAPPK